MAAVVGFILLLASPAGALQWDRPGAEQSFEQARKLHAELSPTATRAEYLACIRAYQKVYLKDPHYGASDDAVFEAGRLYQELGARFGDMADYRNAVKLFKFLVSDYDSSRHCPDALARIEGIYRGPLQDEQSAEEASRALRAKSRGSGQAPLTATKKSPPVQEPVRPEPPPRPARLNAVNSIRHWSTTDYTRVVIDLDGEAAYTRSRLANPDRIFFDITNSKVSSDLVTRTIPVGDTFLKQVRVGQNQVDVVRVVLDFETIGDYSVFELHDPYRIVIDIHGSRTVAATTTPRAAPAASGKVARGTRRSPPAEEKAPEPAKVLQSTEAPVETADARRSPKPSSPPPGAESVPRAAVTETAAAATKTAEGDARPASKRTEPAVPAVEPPSALPRTPARTSKGDRTMTRMLGLKIGRIVLDPGHGGYDTGTIGKSGLREKDVVLDVALELKGLLEEKLGAEVILTRDGDSFVSLEERTAIANQSQADLFISIHSNSSSSRSVSGVETYYLDFARSDADREVAARENATTVRNIRDLQDLVRKIADADKSAESREFASIMQKKLHGDTQQLFGAARNRGVRTAPFVVLIGANMPAILAELGFLSNPNDEKALKLEDTRQRLARALFAGIEGYMQSLGTDLARNKAEANQ